MLMLASTNTQLGLHVHSEINREEDRLTVRKHWRNLNERMHDLGKDGEHETDGLKGQQREDEVGGCLSLEGFH